jgi:2-amino-4-hydroxy-6-hydroxymethyldihydropteridine diphosphokinase
MKAVIALGANLGNPQENLDLAIALLREATDVEIDSSELSRVACVFAGLG